MKKEYPLIVEGDWKKIEAELLKSHVGPKIIDHYFLFAHKGKIKFFVYLVIFGFALSRSSLIQTSRQCILDMPPVASKAFREPENCEFCENVKEVDKVTNVSPEEFLELYSKPARPVVVADGATNWPALQTFDFNFFKQLHEKVEFDRNEVKNCQFFPYKTEFKHLSEVFNMSESRANLEPGEKPWYVGWSNCNNNAGKVLQQYYSKPYFLGNNSENIALSWIFMGGPGYGAQMHVDNVYYPSWQAQLKGKKLWRLVPPPECYLSCHKMEVVVQPGEIIAVDTNKWYHQTLVLPGEISITIGAEFD